MDRGRLRCRELEKKVMSAKDAAKFFKDDMTVGVSGFTPAGYPKAVPMEIANNCEKEKIGLHIISGASVGEELDGVLSKANAIKRRVPYQTNSSCRDLINNGDIIYHDMHLSHTPQYVKSGFLGKMDIALIEAVAITEEGYIVPSTSVGNSNIFVECAEKVIVEINTSQPLELEGVHDIYNIDLPPNRKPIPIEKVDDRIGTPYIKCDKDNILGIVFTDIKDNTNPVSEIDEISKKMADNLIGFLENEVKENRLPKNLLPLQSGVGSVANAILGGLLDSEFEDLVVYSEVIQDSVLDLIEAKKVTFASGTSFTISPERLDYFYKNINKYKDKLILRPQEISNNPEVIRRLGVIAINTAIEVDVYGNVNSTNIMGSRMMNGIGGSGDFTRNGYLSIFTTESIAKDGHISSIVPMVSHHDHTEHDVMVVVTEQGVADLRGLSPRERAESIIKNCAHPDYREALYEYVNESCEGEHKHTPHMLDKAFDMHNKFIKFKSMKAEEVLV
ncbi:acetyl-CoA hydrolase/transferase family protein [Paraclostridium sordellii]|uniref:acetyl-CoA hydrolase/transferase family protein n=1 Tax=Paraclostridium sordellii TaxID=1505 RepID=UPI0005E6BFB1|nr:acetyl-CoA hydrolase/transferase family protein [Paeniclostridium sordellii]CEQ22056.1 succinyl-CoA:coenzyme A transferase [[Clostridium] sordellii] [Paeniclostridium sordellii]